MTPKNKRKRGRPTAAAAHAGQDFADDMKRYFSDKTTRTQAAHFYSSAAYPLLSEAASEIPYLDGIFCIFKSNGIDALKQKEEIIEQLGRMIEQDGYSDNDVLKVASIAAKAYHDGYKVKEIKAYILHGRKTGEW